MPLSWTDIRSNAIAFSREWNDASSEDAEAQSFWNDFFKVFGITLRRVASFEKPVKKSDGKGGFIDLLCKGMVLVEHKSRGLDLDRAYTQATGCFPGLKERDLSLRRRQTRRSRLIRPLTLPINWSVNRPKRED